MRTNGKSRLKANHGNKLVIVESPAKAKTIQNILGKDFTVMGSVGHVRQLDTSTNGVYKFGIDVHNGFKPNFVDIPERRSLIQVMKERLADVEELYLATDPDREGEAIAWDLLEVLKPNITSNVKSIKRMVFTEITDQAVLKSLKSTRELDEDLVHAQRARRMLDRLYGFEVSPMLRDAMQAGSALSGGRVQSPATRLLVDRKRQIDAFVPAEFWDLTVNFASVDGIEFNATLSHLDGRRVASHKDFGPNGNLCTSSAVLLGKAEVEDLAVVLKGSGSAKILSTTSKAYNRIPPKPFTTSELQTEAFRKLRLSSQKTMTLAQELYQAGLITYIRTDSHKLSKEAIQAARRQAADLFGAEFITNKSRRYNAKRGRVVQEAHEAIRPSIFSSDHLFRTPQQINTGLSKDQLALYELIWQNTLAAVMADARGSTVTVQIAINLSSVRDQKSVKAKTQAQFDASVSMITFPGFLAARRETERATQKYAKLDSLKQGQALSIKAVAPFSRKTHPPPHYNEATLISDLVKLGIGRPSTYASIISTILKRGYASYEKSDTLVASEMGCDVVDFLIQNLDEFMTYNFTANLEDDLDRIAKGEVDMSSLLSRFYYGDSTQRGLLKALESVQSSANESTIVSFGQYKGMTYEHVLRSDPSYVSWVISRLSANERPSQPLQRFGNFARKRLEQAQIQ